MFENLLRKAPPEVRRKLQNRNTEITFEDIQERRIQIMNEVKGTLTGYDCPICKNKGVIHYLKDGYEFAKPCECMKLRDSLACPAVVVLPILTSVLFHIADYREHPLCPGSL